MAGRPLCSQFNGHSIVLEAYRAVGYAVAGHGANGGFITGSNPYDGNNVEYRPPADSTPADGPRLKV